MAVGPDFERSGEGGVTGFAERLLAVIDEGRRTATYKLALLIALMDCCAEGVTALGAAPAEVPTRALARHVARLYWPQLRPFPAASGLIDPVRSPTSQPPSSRPFDLHFKPSPT